MDAGGVAPGALFGSAVNKVDSQQGWRAIKGYLHGKKGKEKGDSVRREMEESSRYMGGMGDGAR